MPVKQPETRDFDAKNAVEAIWRAGVNAVSGDAAVHAALTANPIAKPHQIIAVGKAAVPMAAAAVEHFGGEVSAVAFTKYGHAEWSDASKKMISNLVQIHESGHPIVDENSLRSGLLLKQNVEALDKSQKLLLLVSGGASALVEVPQAGLSLENLKQKNSELLSSGLDIHAINARRKKCSQIKGGGLLSGFKGAQVNVLAISDVQGDDITIIGSGIGQCPQTHSFEYQANIIASNAHARSGAAICALSLGLNLVAEAENLYGDVDEVAGRVGQAIRAQRPGIGIYGGEPTVKLPDNPGQGGRNQALAVALAREIAGIEGVCVLVAGTDGSDGPTNAAGGIIDGTSWLSCPGGADALAQADSGTWLEAAGCRFVTGPTGTNVMDLMVVLRS